MFITKLWRGEYSLAKSYWLFSVLASAVLGAPISVIDQLPSATLANIWVYGLIYIGIYAAYMFIAAVGVWRAATGYTNGALWKYLAKIHSALAILSIAGSLVFLGVQVVTKEKGSLLVTECQLNEVLQANSGLETQIWVASTIPCSEITKANLIKALGYGDSYIDGRVKEFNGKLDVNTVLLDEVVKAKKFYPIDKYKTVSQCKLAELKRVKNQTAIPFVTSLINSYCNQYVAVNLSMQGGYQLGRALEAGATYKEIAEYIEANPSKK